MFRTSNKSTLLLATFATIALALAAPAWAKQEPVAGPGSGIDKPVQPATVKIKESGDYITIHGKLTRAAETAMDIPVMSQNGEFVSGIAHVQKGATTYSVQCSKQLTPGHKWHLKRWQWVVIAGILILLFF